MASAMRDIDSEEVVYHTLGIDSLSQVVTVIGSASRGRACAAAPPLRSYDANAGHRS